MPHHTDDPARGAAPDPARGSAADPGLDGDSGRIVRSVVLPFLALGLALTGPAACQTARTGEGAPGPSSPAPGPVVRDGGNDYSDTSSWLCLPARDDACAVDLTTTVIAADGSRTLEPWTANPSPPVDCFYVYPTVSQDPTPTSDMTPGPGENGVVRSQLARFASQCRIFAPLYRQFTLEALRSALAPGGQSGFGALDRDLGYHDILDAWSYYLAEINGGRGVVLIGHSQGASVLLRLIATEIDGTPVQDRIVSALLLGANVAVPRGRDVGGSFQSMPLCRSAIQTGCVVTYSTYRSSVRPGIAGLFGRVAGAGMVAGCTNPAALAGGETELRAYLGAAGLGNGFRWTSGGGPVDTEFVSLPGLLTGECVQRVSFSYLEVTVHGDPADPRTDDIPGDVMLGDEPSRQWGLHLIDVAVAMGDLVDLVGTQSEAYVAREGADR